MMYLKSIYEPLQCNLIPDSLVAKTLLLDITLYSLSFIGVLPGVCFNSLPNTNILNEWKISAFSL